MADRTETPGWRVRLRITTQAQHDLLAPALFEMDGFTETFPKMEIYFSMSNYAIFMVACSLLPKPVDVTKFDVAIVNMKDEPERLHVRFVTPRPITKLKVQPKDDPGREKR